MSANAYRRAAGALTSAALRVTAAVAPRYLERRVAHRFLTPRRPPERACAPPCRRPTRRFGFASTASGSPHGAGARARP